MFKKMDIVRRVFAVGMSLLSILTLVFMSKVNVKASGVVMPISPYIPPATVAIYDILNTVFGVTSPNIQNEYERQLAYARLYEQALGEGWEEFKDTVDQIQQNAAMTNQISISSDMFDKVQVALEQALSNGYYYGTQYDIADTPVEWKAALYDRFGIDMDLNKLQSLYNGRATENQVGKPSVLCWCIYDGGTKILFSTIAYQYYWPSKYDYISNYYRINYNGTLISTAFAKYNYSNGIVGSLIQDAYGTTGVSNVTRQGNTYSSLGDNAQVVAQNSAIETAIQSQEVVPVTADTESVGGNIVINLPNITIYPAHDVADLQEQQEKLGVMPTTPGMTAEQIQDIIDNLEQTKVARYGTTQDYQLHLTEYFPFCIPFDVGNLLTLFVAEPEAPVIQFVIPTGYDTETGLIMTQFEMDLSQFDTVALWCRRGMMLVFIVGLGFITRSMILRG